MKRIISCILTVLLGVCCFTACKGNDESSFSSTSVESSDTYNLHIAQNEVALVVGESVQLEATIDIENVYIFWSVRDENIATVSDEGVVTGVEAGETICYASFGNEKAMCLVKVLEETVQPLLSVTTPYTDEITLFVGDTFDPLITVKLGDSVFKDAQIEYFVTGAGVSVKDGMLVADSTGNATVTVKVSSEGQTASLSLTVRVI